MRAWFACGSTWIVSLVTLAFARDWGPLQIALGFGAFCFVLIGIVRATGSADAEDTLRIPRAHAGAVTGAAIAVLFGALMLATQAVIWQMFGGPHIAPLSNVIAWFAGLHTGYELGGQPFFMTLAFVIVPLAVLAFARVRPRDLGLRLPDGRSRVAALAMLALPVGILIVGLTAGHHTLGDAFLILAMNLLNNGLPEETFFRGVLMSYGRAWLATPWAIYATALAFSLFHVPVTLALEEHGHVVLAIANTIGENLPFGVAMSLLALRTRSLAMPIVLHFSLDALRHMLP